MICYTRNVLLHDRTTHHISPHKNTLLFSFSAFSFSGALAPVVMGGHVGITGAQLLVTGSAGRNAIAPGTAGPASPFAQPLP